jgi:hypothetical protein
MKDEAVFLGFGFVSSQSQGSFEPAPSPKPRQNPKILAPNGYSIFSNALAFGIARERLGHCSLTKTFGAVLRSVTVSDDMKQRYRVFRRGWDTYYCEDTETGKQESLQTEDKYQGRHLRARHLDRLTSNDAGCPNSESRPR